MKAAQNKALHKRRPHKGEFVIQTASAREYECEKASSAGCILRPKLGLATFEISWHEFHEQYEVKH